MKRKSIFRILLMLLILSVTILVFACDNADGGGTNETRPPEQGGGNVTPPGGDINGDDDTTPSLFTPVNADFEGYNFRMLGFDSYQGMWVAVSYSEIYAEELNGDPLNDSIWHRNRAVEELYNIEISLIPLSYGARGGHADVALRSIMAGDDAFDAALIIANQMPRLLTAPNALVELHSIPTLDLSNPWWDQTSVRELSIANQLFTVTGDISLYGAFGTVVIYFNKEMIEDHGLDNPYQLVREGTWTWDALYDMTRAVVRDLDGSGVITVHDQIGMMSEGDSLIFSLLAGGERLTVKDENDLPVLVGSSERLMRAIDTVVGVLRAPQVNFRSGDVTGFSNSFFEFTMPKFRDGELLFFYHQLFTALNLREMEADFGILPAPKLDATQENFGSVTAEWWVTFLSIPQTNQDLDRTGTILEAMAYHSQRLVMPAFYDVTVTHKLARDECSVEMLDIILSNRVFDLGNLYNWGSIRGIFSDIHASGQNNFASRFERQERMIERTMEATLNEILG